MSVPFDRRGILLGAAAAALAPGAVRALPAGFDAARHPWVAELAEARIVDGRIVANGLDIAYSAAGEGPPVLLMHGWPFTRFAWRKTIAALARTHRVIAPDLRGYGGTAKPVAGYDKRTMAADMVALMEALGHDRFAVVGHDRGARVGLRLAKDHPGRVDRLATVDNIPTVYVYERLDARLAGKYWIFAFNAVPDLPEALISGREEVWFRHFLHHWSYDPGFMTKAEVSTYVRALAQPGGLRGGFSDYRAGPEDVAQDLEDRDVRLAMPVMTLWGAEFELVGGLFDVAAVWREFAEDLVGAHAIPRARHMPQEENPTAVNARLADFLADWRG